MMVFVYGRWVNPQNIDAVVPDGAGSIVYMSSGVSFTVPARPSDTMDKIRQYYPIDSD